MRRRTISTAVGTAMFVAGGLIAATPSGAASMTSASVSAAAAGAPCTALTVLRKMTLEQRVGQMFMVGTPATYASSTVLDQISRYHVGNVFLSGRSTGGTSAPSRTTTALRAKVNSASTAGAPLFIATDQEGGYVQVLQGSGFNRIPTALTQGGWPPSTIQRSATVWARQLAGVGINLNLAPVAGTVPGAAAARSNPPIGAFQREYGYTSYKTAAGSAAFVRGMQAGGVAATAKHFPGLGVVTGNTDTTYGVHDRSTSPTSAYINPFRSDVNSGATFIMMSSAIYDRIDNTTLGVFSPKVVDLARKTGFSGPIMSDDLGNAVQPGRWPASNRAVNALYAGVDLILTVNPAALPTMYGAVLGRARSDIYWLRKVNHAAYQVLLGKQWRGLLTNSCSS